MAIRDAYSERLNFKNKFKFQDIIRLSFMITVYYQLCAFLTGSKYFLELNEILMPEKMENSIFNQANFQMIIGCESKK